MSDIGSKIEKRDISLRKYKKLMKQLIKITEEYSIGMLGVVKNKHLRKSGENIKLKIYV